MYLYRTRGLARRRTALRPVIHKKGGEGVWMWVHVDLYIERAHLDRCMYVYGLARRRISLRPVIHKEGGEGVWMLVHVYLYIYGANLDRCIYVYGLTRRRTELRPVIHKKGGLGGGDDFDYQASLPRCSLRVRVSGLFCCRVRVRVTCWSFHKKGGDGVCMWVHVYLYIERANLHRYIYVYGLARRQTALRPVGHKKGGDGVLKVPCSY